jgi:Zn-dependent M28 family amino/carboxypeptidase
MTRAAAVLLIASCTWAQAPAPSVRSAGLVDRATLLRDVQTLSADDMEGRLAGTAGNEKARAYVIARLRASGAQPLGTSYEHPFTLQGRSGSPPADRPGVNVIGRIDGTRRPERFIVVSAHYDHVGTRNGQVFNGANDNASGTAALFAIARHFSANRPLNSLIFAAFDAEEQRLQGSRAFVARPPVDAKALALNINMDMLARDPDDKLFVVGAFRQPYLKPIVERIAATAPVTLLMGHETPGDREDWTQQSDHYAFMEAKIPALYFGVEDFAHLHRPTDDYDTLTHDFYVRAVETMIAAIRAFDADLDLVERGRTQKRP